MADFAGDSASLVRVSSKEVAKFLRRYTYSLGLRVSVEVVHEGKSIRRAWVDPDGREHAAVWLGAGDASLRYDVVFAYLAPQWAEKNSRISASGA